MEEEVQGGERKRNKGHKARRAAYKQSQLKSGYTSDDCIYDTNEVEIMRLIGELGVPQFDVFEMEMKDHVTKSFLLAIPPHFADDHLPWSAGKDTLDHIFELKDSAGLKWEVKYLTERKAFSAGWIRFVNDHRLKEKDIAVFEMVKPNKFLNQITRCSEVENEVENKTKQAEKHNQQQLPQDRRVEDDFPRRRTCLNSQVCLRESSSEESWNESGCEGLNRGPGRVIGTPRKVRLNETSIREMEWKVSE